MRFCGILEENEAWDACAKAASWVLTVGWSLFGKYYEIIGWGGFKSKQGLFKKVLFEQPLSG